MIATITSGAAVSASHLAGGRAEKRVPTARQFSVRQANAERIANRIGKLIGTGHRIYDDEGDEVTEVMRRPNGDIIYVFREGGNVIMFLADSTWDNGAMDSVADYNASFAGWSFVHPKHIRPLKI